MQVGLWVHRASLQLSGIFLSPTSEMLNTVTVLNSISKTVQHLDCRSSTEPVGGACWMEMLVVRCQLEGVTVKSLRVKPSDGHAKE